MRLCGISSRFQLLSPLCEAGYPRVTHPSATQSLKFQSEEIDQSASFDLHVLSTPPAFILSQDQTLMLKVLIQPEYLAFLNQKQVPTGILIQVLLFLRFALLKAVRSSFDDLKFKIFQGYSLFSYQCSLLFPLCSSDLFVIPQLFLSVNNFFKFIFSDFSINCSNFQNIYVPWTRQNVTIAFSFRQVLFLYFYFLFYKKSQRKSSIRR